MVEFARAALLDARVQMGSMVPFASFIPARTTRTLQIANSRVKIVGNAERGRWTLLCSPSSTLTRHLVREREHGMSIVFVPMALLVRSVRPRLKFVAKATMCAFMDPCVRQTVANTLAIVL